MPSVRAVDGPGTLALRAAGGEVELFSIGGVEYKVHGIPAMTQIEQHEHKVDHAGIMISGKVHVVADGVATVYEGFNVIPILANVKHTIIAEEATLWACVFSTHELEEAGEL